MHKLINFTSLLHQNTVFWRIFEHVKDKIILFSICNDEIRVITNAAHIQVSTELDSSLIMLLAGVFDKIVTSGQDSPSLSHLV